MGKRAWRSRTIWVNIIAVVALVAQMEFGFVIDAEEQVALLAVLNLFLRAITKEPLL